MPAVVDDKGSVVVNPTTGKMFSRSSGVGDNLVEDIADRVVNQLAEGRQQSAQEKKEAKEQAAAELQPTIDASERQAAYVPPVSTERSSAPIIGTAASMGVERPVFTKDEQDQELEEQGLSPQFGTSPTQWEQQRAESEGREARTTNYWGEEYEEPSSDILGSIDSQANMIGNTQWNDAYARDAIENGADPDVMYDIMHHDWRSVLLPWAVNGSERDSRDQAGLLGGSTSIDDGTYDYDHLTADNMTGTQYMHYVEMGMGGRPLEEIDPTRVYSKRRENIGYGFIPFTPDTLSYANMVADNVMDVPARAGAWVGNLRENIGNRISPYEIVVQGDDGTTKRVNGPDFDRIGGAYVHQMEREDIMSEKDPTVLEFPVPDVNGQMTYHYGYLNGVGDYGDGTYALDFSDGTTVDIDGDFFDSITNGDGTVSMRDFSPVTKSTARGQFPEVNDDTIYYQEHPNLVMPDGTELTYDEARSIFYDQEPENSPSDPYDDNIKYDFDTAIPFLDNRPNRLNSEIFGNGGIDISTIGNNVVDWTLGSIPISMTMLVNPVTGGVADLSAMPWLYSASNASSSLGGIDPGTYDVQNDSYGLAFGNYDDDGNLRYGVTTPDGEIDESLADEAQFWNALGNFTVPLTEEIVGPVGEELVPVRKMLGWDLPANPTTSEVIKDFLAGMAEEGIEEDLGNIFDEITSYGPSGAFAQQAVNESGAPMYDLTGHEVRDVSTPMSERLRNFANPRDLANSFAGGALVDAAMQMNPIMPGNLWSNIGTANRAKRVRQELGIDRLVEPEERERQSLPESYLAQFSD